MFSLSTTGSNPPVSDGAALGSATLMWSDLFLASGAVINFNNSNVTLTHSANALTLEGGQILLPNGTLSLPALAFSTKPLSGLFIDAGGDLNVVSRGGATLVLYGNGQFIRWQGVFLFPSAAILSWNSDLDIVRDGAATLQMGLDSAAPVAQTLKGCDARAGTDSNTAGGDLTIATGRGTGTGTVGVLYFQSTVTTTGGTGAQTLANRGKVTVDGVSSLMGLSTAYATPVGIATVITTNVGNVDAGEDVLMTYDLPANSLSAAKKGIEIIAWGTGANNINAKTLKLYFGTQVILTTSLTVSQTDTWRVVANIVSTGTDAQDWSSQLFQAGTISQIDIESGTSTIDDGAAITIKCSGEATTTNDIVQEGMIVKMLN